MWQFSSPKFESSSVSGYTPYGVSVTSDSQPLSLESQGENFINLDESYFRNVARESINGFTEKYTVEKNNKLNNQSIEYFLGQGGISRAS